MNGTELAFVEFRMTREQMSASMEDVIDARDRWNGVVPERAQLIAMRVALECALIRLAWPILTQLRTQNRERQP